MTDYNATRAEAMASHAKRATMYGGQSQAYASGGGVHSDEKQDRALIKTILAKEEKKEAKRADGGSVEGRARGGRADRPKHGSKTVVNVVAPQMPAAPPRPVPVPVPMKPPMAGGPPGAMPPGAAGMGPPPGGPPPGMPMRAGGGKITGGALSGVGRLEKAAGGIKGPMIARE